jgi:integrase
VSVYVVEDAWWRIRADAGLDDVRLHEPRHTVGTWAARTGANAFQIRDVLRHKGVAMTSRYVTRRRAASRAHSGGG